MWETASQGGNRQWEWNEHLQWPSDNYSALPNKRENSAGKACPTKLAHQYYMENPKSQACPCSDSVLINILLPGWLIGWRDRQWTAINQTGARAQKSQPKEQQAGRTLGAPTRWAWRMEWKNLISLSSAWQSAFESLETASLEHGATLVTWPR